MMDFDALMGQEHNEDNQRLNLVGHYANYFKVGHSAFEFVFDFGQLYTEKQSVQFHTRVIASPYYAKVLVNLLQDSINQHEQNFGAIPNNESM